MVNCSRCGKKIKSQWVSKWRDQPVCDECFRVYLGKKCSQKECVMCAFSEKQEVLTEKKVFSKIWANPTIEYQKTDKWNCKKFGLDVTYELNHAETCSSFITKDDYTKKCLAGELEAEKSNIQILLDFSSLKDTMAKGGLVMTTYKCPNCNGMVNIPEAGKVLVCQYCGTPIKPVDIFEKIKGLIT